MLKLITLTLGISSYCSACLTLWEPTQVGTSFRIKVENSQGPVAGLRLNLTENRRISAVTDQDGFAAFSALAPGEYYVRADHPAGDLNLAYVNVDPIGPRSLTVNSNWPQSQILTVKSLRGRIRGPYHYLGKPERKLSFELFEGVSGRKLEGFQTTETGEFNVPNVAAGLYFLYLNPPDPKDDYSIRGQIVVAVRPDATADHLDIDLGFSDCGLTYTNQIDCHQRDIQADRLAGVVTDLTGAVISNARISVFEHEKLVKEAQTDNSGNFSLPLESGTYGLVVSSVGMSPFQGTAHLKPTNNVSMRRSLFTIVLELSGSCSSAVPR